VETKRQRLFNSLLYPTYQQVIYRLILHHLGPLVKPNALLFVTIRNSSAQDYALAEKSVKTCRAPEESDLFAEGKTGKGRIS
jgi:hypothetical protein